MLPWIIDSDGVLVFSGGHDDWTGTARLAAACSCFADDVEDEQVSDDPRSCYNCRFRRWTATSFVCAKKSALNCLGDEP